MKRFVVDADKIRADVFLASKYPKFARSAIAKIYHLTQVSANGQTIKPGQKLKFGDKIEVDDTLLVTNTTKIDLPIIYEDKDVTVIDKPVGVLSHSTGGLSNEASVASSIRDKYSGELSGERAGIVHRLDRATSGVMITAKNKETMNYLQKQFSQRKVLKTYLAIIVGRLDPAAGIIDMPIARDARSPKLFKPDNAGRHAQTEYETLNTSAKDGKAYSLVKLSPQTGRTHQLRVHLKHAGHPIVGDELYGGSTAKRMMLHASELKIALPDGEVKTFHSPMPKEFYEYVDK